MAVRARRAVSRFAFAALMQGGLAVGERLRPGHLRQRRIGRRGRVADVERGRAFGAEGKEKGGESKDAEHVQPLCVAASSASTAA